MGGSFFLVAAAARHSYSYGGTIEYRKYLQLMGVSIFSLFSPLPASKALARDCLGKVSLLRPEAPFANSSKAFTRFCKVYPRVAFLGQRATRFGG